MQENRMAELSQRAQACLASGQLEQARDVYSQLTELDANNEETWLMLAAVQGETGNLPEALRCAEKAIAIDSTYVEAYLTKAHLLQRLDRLEDAIDSALNAVEKDDQYGEAWLFLGGLAGRLGRTEDAVAWAGRAVSLLPESTEALVNLGNAHYQKDQFVQAEADFRKAAQITPGVFAAELGVAKSIAAQQRYAEAIPLLEAAVAREPDNVEALDHLGGCYIALGRRDEAVAIFDKIIYRQPGYVHAYLRMARMFSAQGDYEEAIEYLNRGRENAENPLQILGDLAKVYHDLGMPHMAINVCEEALELDPDNFVARFYRAVCLGNYTRYEEAIAELDSLELAAPGDKRIVIAKAGILERIGDVDEAYRMIKPLLATDPGPEVVAIYARLCHRYDDCDKVVTLMDGLLTRKDLPADDRSALLFALGQVLDRQQNHDKAFTAYAEANALKPYRYDHQKFVRYVDRLMAPEITGLIADQPMVGEVGRNVTPVFIVGMPRSGTSLVEQIIASHPKAFGGGERHEMALISHRLSGWEGSDKEYPECLPDLPAEMMSTIADGYAEFANTLPPGTTVMTDKMPGNYVHLVLIRLLFPDARIIHCTRNPVDTCLSCYFQQFTGYHDYAYDLSDLGVHYVEYKRLMDYYRDKAGMPMLEISYEDLVADTERLVRKIIAYCGLEWDEQCLRFYESDRVMRTASYDQVRKPIYTTSVERWRHYEKHLTPLLDALGAGSG